MKNLLKYIGQKRLDITELVEKFDIKVYCEPFAGSFNTGFLTKGKYPDIRYILNDIEPSICNFWEQAKDDIFKLNGAINAINNEITGVKEFDDIQHILVSKLELNDKVMNAAVMFIMSNSRMYGGNSDDIENTKGMDLGQLIGYSKLLDNVEIRNSDYKDVIRDEDSDKTLFLIDPPYYIKKVDSYYKCDCKYVYHREIADNIRKINGKFLLTYNISDYIKGLYDCFRRFEVDNGAYINELMITNMDLNEDDIRRIYKGIKTVKIV